jgi:hypothetical protein
MGIFDAARSWLGTDDESSSDPNSPNFAGGSWNIFGMDPKYTDKLYNLSDKLSAYGDANVRKVVSPDANGFMPYQYAGMGVLAKNLFAQGSAQHSARGMQAPENQNAIVGSALTQALPNLFNLQNQNQFIPGEVNKQNMALMTAPMVPLQQLGAVGQRSIGPGTGYNNINAANSNWWDMWNNIGSAWGSMGTSGGGGGGVK